MTEYFPEEIDRDDSPLQIVDLRLAEDVDLLQTAARAAVYVSRPFNRWEIRALRDLGVDHHDHGLESRQGSFELRILGEPEALKKQIDRVMTELERKSLAYQAEEKQKRDQAQDVIDRVRLNLGLM